MPDQITKYSASDREQAELDRMSLTLANLDPDSRMCVVVNAFVYEAHGATTAISSLAQLMVTLAVTLDDDEVKLRVAKALRDAGTMFENAVISSDPKRVN